ncbi:hypothetical protein [Cysteiniphilum halobium]|uniref:hypothetical protein n=1 Tax=Cysteiniphilum halobium TaxID=2219059 RepID=UPI003F859A2B
MSNRYQDFYKLLEYKKLSIVVTKYVIIEAFLAATGGLITMFTAFKLVGSMLIVAALLWLFVHQIVLGYIRKMNYRKAASLISSCASRQASDLSLDSMFNANHLKMSDDTKENLLYLLKLCNSGEVKLYGRDVPFEHTKGEPNELQRLTPCSLSPEKLNINSKGELVIRQKDFDFYDLHVDKKDVYKHYRLLKSSNSKTRL